MFNDTTNLFLSTAPLDEEQARSAVKAFYVCCNKLVSEWRYDKKEPINDDPEIFFVDGPIALMEKIDANWEWVDLTHYNPIAHFVTKRGWSRHDHLRSVINCHIRRFLFDKLPKPGWNCPAMIVQDYLYVENDEERPISSERWEKAATAVWNQCYYIVTGINQCYVMQRPVETYVNESGFHNADGPAVMFADGTKIYCHHGMMITEEQFLHPEQITLKEIHESHMKQYLIDLVGVDHYMEMVKQWKVDVKGRFKKFFGFAEMIVPGDENIEKSWDKKGKGHHHVEKPYEVTIGSTTLNGQHGLLMKERNQEYTMYFCPQDSRMLSYDPFVHDCGQQLFEPEDKELWDALMVSEMVTYRSCHRITIGYQNGRFYLRSGDNYPGTYYRDVVPAWCKAKRMRGEDFVFDCDQYTAVYRNRALRVVSETLEIKDPLIRDEFAVPHYEFRLNLESDSWEGLLEQWVKLAFEWLGMCCQ